MKCLNFFLVGLSILTVTIINAAPSNELTTATDKFSSVIGLNMGKTFKQQDIQLNPNQVLKGLQDGMSGAKPLLDKAQQQQIVAEYQAKIQKREAQEHAQAVAKLKQQAIDNAQAGKTFLAENAKNPGVITLPSGLQYKVLTAGKGASPTANDKVTVNYEGKLLDGTIFDSSYKRKQPFTTDIANVIPGWRQALEKMHPGATWMLYVPAELAYGEQGDAPLIPPNSTLIFKINLMTVDK